MPGLQFENCRAGALKVAHADPHDGIRNLAPTPTPNLQSDLSSLTQHLTPILSVI